MGCRRSFASYVAQSGEELTRCAKVRTLAVGIILKLSIYRPVMQQPRVFPKTLKIPSPIFEHLIGNGYTWHLGKLKLNRCSVASAPPLDNRERTRMILRFIVALCLFALTIAPNVAATPEAGDTTSNVDEQTRLTVVEASSVKPAGSI